MGARVLVVSGHHPARDRLRLALGPDWEVLETSSGVGGREVMRTEALDLVVCDDTAEPYGGFGFCRELKTNFAEPPPVIILLEREQDAWLCRWAGADRWLLQPPDPFALATAARELVAARRAERAGPAPDAP